MYVTDQINEAVKKIVGNEVTTIVGSGLGFPCGITYDESNNRVIFADQVQDGIFSVKTTGGKLDALVPSQRNLVTQGKRRSNEAAAIQYPYGVAYDKRYGIIIATQPDTHTIKAVRISKGAEQDQNATNTTSATTPATTVTPNPTTPSPTPTSTPISFIAPPSSTNPPVAEVKPFIFQAPPIVNINTGKPSCLDYY